MLARGALRGELLGRRVPQRVELGDARVGVLASPPGRQPRLLAPLRQGCLGRLAPRRRRRRGLGCLHGIRLGLRHPRFAVARHCQQRAFDLARPPPGPLELVRQLAGARGELALGALVLRALLLEALRPAPASVVDQPRGLFAGLLDLGGGRGVLLRRGALELADPCLGRVLRLRRHALGFARPAFHLGGARTRGMQRPRGLGQALLELLLAGRVARVPGAHLALLGLELGGPGDLACPRLGLLVEPARQQGRLLALPIALGAHAADVTGDLQRHLLLLTLSAHAQVLDLLLGARHLAPQLGDLAFGAQQLLLVALAHAALLLDAALQLLEQLRADHVEAVPLGQGVMQALTQLRVAVLGS